MRLSKGGARTFEAPHIFINFGTRPTIPDLPGLADVLHLDNNSVIELDVVPAHLLVLGGGFVGLEFAHICT